MKLFTKLSFLSAVIYCAIQYSVSIRIDAGNDQNFMPFATNVHSIQAVRESPREDAESHSSAGDSPQIHAITQISPGPSYFAYTSAPVKPVEKSETAKSDTPANPNSSDAGFAVYDELPYFIPGNVERYSAYKLNNPDLLIKTIVTYVNIGLDKPFYTDVNVIPNPGSLTVLINKYNKLPESYIPKLSRLDPSYCDPVKNCQYLRPEAKAAFEKMCGDAKAHGLKILAYGTYRSQSAQSYIWDKKIKDGGTIEEVDAYNARGGYSEHNAGLAVDIAGKYSIKNTNEYKWYIKNAHKYGFILRYPYGKESVTGYKYEPWHLRYIGVETATAVYKSGLTYDEYYIRYISPAK